MRQLEKLSRIYVGEKLIPFNLKADKLASQACAGASYLQGN